MANGSRQIRKDSNAIFITPQFAYTSFNYFTLNDDGSDQVKNMRVAYVLVDVLYHPKRPGNCLYVLKSGKGYHLLPCLHSVSGDSALFDRVAVETPFNLSHARMMHMLEEKKTIKISGMVVTARYADFVMGSLVSGRAFIRK